MATVAQTVGEDELEIFIENSQPIAADAVAFIIQRVVDIARSSKFGGPECRVDLVEIRTGSLLMRFKISAEWVTALATVGMLAVEVAKLFNGGSEAGISAQIARMIEASEVQSVIVTTRTQTITVDKEALQPPSLPQVAEAPRPAEESGEAMGTWPTPWRLPAHLPNDRGDLASLESRVGEPDGLLLTGVVNASEPPTFTTYDGATLPVVLRLNVGSSLILGSPVRVLAFVRRRRGGELYLLLRAIENSISPGD